MHPSIRENCEFTFGVSQFTEYFKMPCKHPNVENVKTNMFGGPLMFQVNLLVVDTIHLQYIVMSLA